MKIIASQEFSGWSDTWTDYLCIEISANEPIAQYVCEVGYN
jgi:hypothetical protein